MVNQGDVVNLTSSSDAGIDRSLSEKVGVHHAAYGFTVLVFVFDLVLVLVLLVELLMLVVAPSPPPQET